MGAGETFRSNSITPGMALGENALNVTLAADNALVNAGRMPFVRLTSDSATATARTFTLASGVVDGQVLNLVLVGAASQRAELLSTGNVILAQGTWQAAVNDTICLQWDQISATWRERSRATAATLIAGRYTPTVTVGANVVSGSAISSLYMRVGNIVTVNITSLVVCTAATLTASVVSFSLPVASTLVATTDLSGVATRLAATGTDFSAGTVIGVLTTNLARVDFNATTTASSSMSVSFSYEVL